MVIKTFLLIFIIHTTMVNAQNSSEVDKTVTAYKNKKCQEVVKLYQQNKENKDYIENPLVQKVASFCFNNQKKYKESIQIKIHTIKKNYLQEHKTITKLIKDGESLNADEYPEKLKILYWNIFQNYTNKIIDAKKDNPELRKDFSRFITFKNILSLLEFKEDLVDQKTDEVTAHIKALEDKVYKLTKRVFIDYLSWQREMRLNMPSGSTNLSVTNLGFCAGGAIGYENSAYHFFADGCLVYASGSVGAVKSNPTYQQGKVPVYGLKTSLAAGFFLSPNKTEIGFKIPILYSVQTLTDPPQDSFPGYKVEGDGANLSVITAVYFRWPFQSWFFQTEFGKYIDQDSTLWSLGGGYKF